MALLEKLKNFEGHEAGSEEELTKMFKELAKHILYGGYFLVDDKLKIFPKEIEFYFHCDGQKDEGWNKDYGMYHIGNEEEMPYFPACSLFPHSSGVDVRFENEKHKFRASFLIRNYYFIDGDDFDKFKKPEESQSLTQIWEDMFGHCSLTNEGLKIKWEESHYDTNLEVVSGVRINLCKYDAPGKPTTPTDEDRKENRVFIRNKKELVQDQKPWRFGRNTKVNTNDDLINPKLV